MLRRKVLPQIEEWHQGGCRKALLLTGARQVGKTTVVREFAKQHYAHFVEVNFVKRPIAQKAFDGDLDTKTIITNLSAMGFGPFVEGKTLVFLDEIQECPNARTAIKFLVEEQNKITVIEVKSGEKYKKHASLDAAVKDYTDKIHRSIVLSRYNVSRKDDVLYLPLYMTIFI